MGKSTQSLEELIHERSLAGADVARIDRRIWDLFGEKWCVVFTDMCGFSRRSAQGGIIPFLVLIQRMREICEPIWEKHSGFVLKTIADSQVVLFRDAKKGLRACLDVSRALHSRNSEVDETERIYLGCGLGYGDVLKLGDDDVFGVEVNFAAKLGEDIAGPYDVFVTSAFAKKVGRVRGVEFREVKRGRLGGTKEKYFSAEFEVKDKRDHRKKARRTRVRFR